MNLALTNKEAMVVYGALYLWIHHLSKIPPKYRSNQDISDLAMAESIAELIRVEREKQSISP